MGTIRKTYNEALNEISDLLANIQKHIDFIQPPKLLGKSRPLSPVSNQKLAVLLACQHYLRGNISGSELVKILQNNPKYDESALLNHSTTKELAQAACSIAWKDIKLVRDTLVVDKSGFVYGEK